jgi:hypothetical protein
MIEKQNGLGRDDALVRDLAGRVTERDRAICRSLHEHRVLTTTQLGELHFNGIERARKRLELLHQLRVLDRFRPHRDHGSHPYHYLLDRLGAELLAAERGLELADLHWSRARMLRLASSQQLTHLTQASGFFTSLTQAARNLPGAGPVEWWGQRRCAQAWGELVRPDGYAHLTLPAGRLELWLEWDRATEPHHRIREKQDRYEELATAINQPIRLLLVLPSDRREREILRDLQPPGRVTTLTTTADRHHAGPLARNWLAPGAEQRAGLSDLASRAGRHAGIDPCHRP